ncbi:hypothetical protein FS837_005762 [Tulasnella sp. UAMH 9824]|nr:hypothetical protein FS837_005762 [Tulasnella sp. UAMH 9824]
MPIKRGRKSLKNLGDYARKRARHDAIEIEDGTDEEAVKETKPEEPVSVEPELSSASDFDKGALNGPEDAEELLMQNDEEVEELFSQLENHFAQTLHVAQARLEHTERLKS